MYRLFLAIRYLLTRPINLLGMFGIAIGSWALVVVVALFTGFIEVIEAHVHEASADVSVSQLPPWAEWSRLRDAQADDPNVAATAPRLVHYGLLHRPGRRPPPAPLPGRTSLNGGDQPFVFVLGVDPAAEAAVTGFTDWIRSARIPPELRAADPAAPLAANAGRATMLIGLERMQADGLRPGDELVLTTGRLTEGDDGARHLEQIAIPFVVAGAFKSRHGGFDGNNVLVARETLRGPLFADAPDGVQEVAVRVRDAASLDETADRLERAVQRCVQRDQRAYCRVETWREKNHLFLASVQHQRGLLKIVLIVIMVTAAFLMLATLSMMVTEKTSDIGILTAMGGTPFGVTQVFLTCGLTITAAGVALGIGTGCVTAVYLEEIRQALRFLFGVDLFPIDVYNLDRVPHAIEPLWLLQVLGMALGTGTVV
jgi:lipoprotein-releasing system permease protein